MVDWILLHGPIVAASNLPKDSCLRHGGRP